MPFVVSAVAGGGTSAGGGSAGGASARSASTAASGWRVTVTACLASRWSRAFGSDSTTSAITAVLPAGIARASCSSTRSSGDGSARAPVSATNELPSSSVSTGARSAVRIPAMRGWRSARVPSVSRSPTCSPIVTAPSGSRRTIAAERSVNPSPGSVSATSTGSVGEPGSSSATTSTFSCGVPASCPGPSCPGPSCPTAVTARWWRTRGGRAGPGRRPGWPLAAPYRTRHAASCTVDPVTDGVGEQRWEVVQAGPFRYCS